MLLKIFVLVCLFFVANVEALNIHRVSKLKIKLEEEDSTSSSGFKVTSSNSREKIDFSNPKYDKFGNTLPAFGNKFNLTFSALDSELDLELEVVKDVLADDAVIIVPGSNNETEPVTHPVINNVYSKSYTDSEGNDFQVFLNVFSPTIVNGYLTKNGVDYKFAPLFNMRNEIKSMAKRFKHSRYTEQLTELDSIFGPESESDSEEMVLIDLSELPEDPLHKYQADPSRFGLNSTESEEDAEAPSMDFQTDASSSERAPLTLTMWPSHCHSFMTADTPGQIRKYGLVDIILDYSGFSYYNSLISHPHMTLDDQTRQQLISNTLISLMSKTNYYYNAQLSFTHRAYKFMIFSSPNIINTFSAAALPYGTQLTCRSQSTPNPLCQVNSATYFSNLVALRPLYHPLSQNPPYERTASVVAFTGMFASTADAYASPNTYAKASVHHLSIVLIPVFAPKPYNTLAKMFGIQMGAKATNDYNGACASKGTNYMSGVMGNADGVINTESLDAGKVGIAKGCNFTELCNYIKSLFTSSDIIPNVIRNAQYHYVNPLSKCGNFREEPHEYCEVKLDPVCCNTNCLPKLNSRCWSADPQCCVGCLPQPNSKVCYTHDGIVGLCGKGGYCRPSHCPDYNPDYVPCPGVGNPCEEMCKHKNAADSTCIALPTDVRHGDECKLSATTTGVCVNKTCVAHVYDWVTDAKQGKYCNNNNLYEYVYCGDQTGNKVDEELCDWEADIPHGWLGPCTPPGPLNPGLPF